MITVEEHVKQLQEIIKNHPDFAKLPIVYAQDDEGNNYQLVNNLAGIFAVYDLNERDLKPNIDILTQLQDGIDVNSEGFKYLNCVIIN